ncbi:MAG: hypothetical protein WA418_27755, partial [Bradyrhizobium sp.]
GGRLQRRGEVQRAGLRELHPLLGRERGGHARGRLERMVGIWQPTRKAPRERVLRRRAKAQSDTRAAVPNIAIMNA